MKGVRRGRRPTLRAGCSTGIDLQPGDTSARLARGSSMPDWIRSPQKARRRSWAASRRWVSMAARRRPSTRPPSTNISAIITAVAVRAGRTRLGGDLLIALPAGRFARGQGKGHGGD